VIIQGSLLAVRFGGFRLLDMPAYRTLCQLPLGALVLVVSAGVDKGHVTYHLVVTGDARVGWLSSLAMGEMAAAAGL
jgi:hypothetical protein